MGAGGLLVGLGFVVARGAQPDILRYLGVVLIGVGDLGLIAAVLAYRAFTDSAMRKETAPLTNLSRASGRAPALGMAVLLIEVGLFAFCAALLQGR